MLTCAVLFAVIPLHFTFKEEQDCTAVLSKHGIKQLSIKIYIVYRLKLWFCVVYDCQQLFVIQNTNAIF